MNVPEIHAALSNFISQSSIPLYISRVDIVFLFFSSVKQSNQIFKGLYLYHWSLLSRKLAVIWYLRSFGDPLAIQTPDTLVKRQDL